MKIIYHIRPLPEKIKFTSDRRQKNDGRTRKKHISEYIFYELNEEEHNFFTFIKMINSMEVREEDKTFINSVDYIFEELELGTKESCKKYNMKIESDREINPPQQEYCTLSQYKNIN